MAIREGGDNGTLIVAADPDGEHAKAYCEIAKSVWTKINEGNIDVLGTQHYLRMRRDVRI